MYQSPCQKIYLPFGSGKSSLNRNNNNNNNNTNNNNTIFYLDKKCDTL